MRARATAALCAAAGLAVTAALPGPASAAPASAAPPAASLAGRSVPAVPDAGRGAPAFSDGGPSLSAHSDGGRSVSAGDARVVTGAEGLAVAGDRAASRRVPPGLLRLARQPLAADDGWAAAGAGTTGGAAADAANISVVRNRSELIAALGGNAATNGTNATPKIIVVSGRIRINADADNRPLSCADYADPEYSLDAYLATYDPAVWGRDSEPTGPLEEARVRSAKRQSDTIRINVGSNTTIIGLPGARIDGGNLILTNVNNVIVRGIEFTDAADCFPAWDPTDGDAGNWNSLYDLVSLSGATNVWLDHNTFSDGNNHDSQQPVYFGRPYQVHDGATDIIRGSDLVTVSYNDYYDHDKTMLIGSTDNPGVDVGKLRVTVHHNRFANVIQRAPRVRFGQVDVYNNAYTATDDSYEYSLGVGFESAIYAENNVFLISADIGPGDLLRYWKGTRITAIGTLVKVGHRPARPVDLVAAHNAAYDPDLSPDAGWVPTLRPRVHPSAAVWAIVNATAGARRLHR